MLEEIKNYLNITWEDEDIDNKLKSLIEQSKQSIKNLMGADIDFTKNLEMKELLFNRVRYAYNNAIEYFESNFAHEILRLQLQEGVKKLEK
jgi:DNA packaging protein, QLRG family|uniref:Head Tail Connector Protein n=1 Tax=Siphoviridae sp. ctGz830 TaxID=2827825 RepID=A0A8S5T9Y5_9CAUD|nr:MAG TPA: Head Tail Connector Protein [Siphoviridae sp. ctGz830]